MKAFLQNDATYSQNNDFADWLKLAGKDYNYLLNQVHWEALLSRVKRILDVGCGKAFFPDMLFRHIDVSGASLEYSALDPVQSCLDRSEEVLSRFPIRIDGLYNTTIEEANLPKRFDLIWCLKSLYLVEADRIRESLLNIYQMLGEDGVAIIFHCTGKSFIIDYHNNVFNKSSLAKEIYFYNTSERIEEELRATGIKYRHACGGHKINISTDNKEVLSSYLSKGSLIVPLSFSDFAKDKRIQSHLDDRIESGEYLFSHSYKVIMFGPGMTKVETNSNFELST